jgi:phenylalanyl-tRNA synthetase alpha chain
VDFDALADYVKQASEALAGLENEADLQVWHQAHLAKAGRLTAYKRAIGQLPQEQRKDLGQTINRAARQLEQAFTERSAQITEQSLAKRMQQQSLDVTLPPRARRKGRYHPVTQMLREVCRVFENMGFTTFESPHVELDETCFQQLNIPKHHPARDMQDTFFISEEVVLRPHTSPGQIRAMRRFAPEPIQVIFPGLCYRYEDVTPRSEIQFHQVEGFLVGQNVCFSDLKGILLRFARTLFGEQQAIRLRGSYFPFTEPSVEVDIQCTLCLGNGCRVCKNSGWLELGGAGMVHPQVLENGGYDPERMRGIAFGMGIERMVLLRYQIEDIRYFFQNDLRFLKQFV